MTLEVVALLFAGIEAVTIAALLVARAGRIRAERIRRASEERFRLVLDRMPVIIWTARPDTTLDYVNGTCLEFTGMPIEKVRDEGWLDAVHPDDRERCTSTYGPAFEERRPFLMEYRARRADGEYRWLLASGVPMFGPAGGFEGFLGCDVDITERKNAEERIREDRAALEVSNREIQHLAGRIITAQDTERARVARDLHDDVSQQLAGLSIAISVFKRRLDGQADEELQAELRALHLRTSELAQNVRNLSHDLHPTVLRHAGLLAALKSYCTELQNAHGIVLECSAAGDLEALPPEVALCLYRIAQESLRNVVAHAGARRVDVQLALADEHAELSITDDGRGFDVAHSRERAAGLGLVSMTERVRLFSGSLSLVSEPDKGTRVCARLPVRARPEAQSTATISPREFSRS